MHAKSNKKILFLIICLFTLTACGSKKYSLSPENMLKYALNTTSTSFFDVFNCKKESAGVSSEDGFTVYQLSEEYDLNHHSMDISLQFENDIWKATTYTALFEGDSYLEDAYTFMYTYDEDLKKSFGAPLGTETGSSFLQQADTYQKFYSQKLTADDQNSLLFWNVGDTYEISDYVLNLGLTADSSMAKVTVMIYPYTTREIGNDVNTKKLTE